MIESLEWEREFDNRDLAIPMTTPEGKHPREATRRDFLRNVAVATGGLALARGDGAWAASKPPNILFLFPDQLRSDWVEPNPEVPVKTPNLNRLAGDGVRFTGAVTPSPLCAPARACLASGKEYDGCRVPGNGVNYPLDQTTFYSRLRDAGYHVMGCGKFDLHKPELNWGADGQRLVDEWGFSSGIDSEGKWDAIRAYADAGKPTGPYFTYLEDRGQAKVHVDDFGRRRGVPGTFPTPLSDVDYCDNWIARNGLELLEKAPGGRSWFLQVNFNGPHSPWDVTKGMRARWRDVEFPQPNGRKDFTPKDHNAIRQNYAAMIENIDRWLGIYVETLRKRGELENTLIVFSSDHGEMLGDYGLWGKTVPYHASAGVPLAISGPGVGKGVVCEVPATTLDLTATFLDFAGVPVPGGMDSRSLRPYLEGKTVTHREYVLSGLFGWREVFDGRYKYVRGFGKTPLLFDVRTDPFENENLVDERPELAARLSAILDREGVGKGKRRRA